MTTITTPGTSAAPPVAAEVPGLMPVAGATPGQAVPATGAPPLQLGLVDSALAALQIRVLGVPAPQGSKRAFRNKHTGRIHQVESSKAVQPWREAVKAAAAVQLDATGWVRLEGPVAVVVWFVFARPKGHYGGGRNAHLLKDSAPPYPITSPDVDKLVRSTFDALTDAGVWRDDKLVAHVSAWKVYESASDGLPGARITVQGLTS